MFKLEELVKKGFYILVFLLPWQTRLIISQGSLNETYYEYGTISLYAIDILIFVLLILNSIILWQSVRPRKERIKISWYWWLLALLELELFVSIFQAENFWLAFFGYIRFLLGLGVFWLVIKINWEKTKLFIFFLSGILIQAIIGIWQFLSQSDFENKWLGISLHLAADAGTSVIEVIGADGIWQRWLRAYGGLDHPNVFGVFMSIGVLIILYLLYQNYQLKEKNKYHFLGIFSLIIVCWAVLFSFSRNSWLSLIISLLFLLFMSIWYRKLWLHKYLLICFFIIGISFSSIYYLQPNLISARLKAAGRLESKSLNERQTGFIEAKKLISNNFWFGVGINNYGHAVASHIKTGEKGYYYQPVHNTYLLILSEAGIIGFVLFTLVIVISFIKLFFTKKLPIETSRIIYSGFIFIIVLSMFFDHWWWSLHFGIILFWLILAIAVKESE